VKVQVSGIGWTHLSDLQLHLRQLATPNQRPSLMRGLVTLEPVMCPNSASCGCDPRALARAPSQQIKSPLPCYQISALSVSSCYFVRGFVDSTAGLCRHVTARAATYEHPPSTHGSPTCDHRARIVAPGHSVRNSGSVGSGRSAAPDDARWFWDDSGTPRAFAAPGCGRGTAGAEPGEHGCDPGLFSL